ncbi:hypothetical protein EAF04_005899 [Stromatinia cepivora]|nr:hypothetical protein EAF04_005899 [Stromatinia cepivora]
MERAPILHRRPLISRKYGQHFVRLEAESAASLNCREFGKVTVDCRLCLSKSQWGVLGENERPAGIIYMDLNFNQPADCRLSSATVVITLERYETAEERTPGANNMASSLCVTDHFGPKQLKGELRTMPVEKKYQFTPN